MFRFVFRQLVHEPGKSGLIVAAIAAVVAVILLLEGFNEGLVAQLRQAVINRGADLIVTQAGVANMAATRSILPQFVRGDVEAVGGVAEASPLTMIPMIYEHGSQRTPISLLVYDSRGGPLWLAEGAEPREPRDIVVDRSLAYKHGLTLGQPLLLSDFEFRISGISSGAAAFFTPFGFVRYDDLIDFYFESDVAADITSFPMLSFLLVRLVPGAVPGDVAAAIEQAVPAADVFTPAALADRDAALGRALFGPILRFMIDTAYLIGVLVIGVVMFAAVNARRRSFGILKAVGFPNAYLGRAVLLEALLLTVLALPLGILVAAGIAAGFESVMPLYLLRPLEPVPVARTVAISLLFAVAGGLLPLRGVRRVDPALVFRS